MPDNNKPISFDPYTYTGSTAVQLSHGYIMVVCGAALFFIINVVAAVKGPPSKVTGDVWRWRNTFVSFLHAAIVGGGVLYCLMFKDMFHDLILFCDNFSYLLLAFSLGYFVYDVFDHFYNKRILSNYEVIIHHVAVLWSFGYNIQYRMNIGYTIVALMTEINSVFLHARKLMLLDKWPYDHWLYRSMVILNLLTFITFRFAGIVFVGYGLIVEKRRMTYIFSTLLSIAMILMYIINPILLWRLIKNDILRNLHPKRLKMNGNNNNAK